MNQEVAVGVVFVAAMFMSIKDATIVNVALLTIGPRQRAEAVGAGERPATTAGFAQHEPLA